MYKCMHVAGHYYLFLLSAKCVHAALCVTAGRHKIQSVGEWLDSLGLGQYENTLVANGFDDTDFLVSCALSFYCSMFVFSALISCFKI